MKEIMISTETVSVAGFNFRPGFVALFEGEDLAAATSGWAAGGNLYVYRPGIDGSWSGSWEGPETFPVADVLEAIQDWQDSENPGPKGGSDRECDQDLGLTALEIGAEGMQAVQQAVADMMSTLSCTEAEAIERIISAGISSWYDQKWQLERHQIGAERRGKAW